MADFVTLSCPSCGGKLEITNDVERFACSHCGREHVVKRSGGVVSLSPVVDALNKVGVGVDKTAAELAIVRLKEEITYLQRERNTLLQQWPRPEDRLNFIYISVIVLGFLLPIISLLVTKSSSDNAISAFFILVMCASPFLIPIGAVLLFFYRRDLKNWNETTRIELKSLDGQIATKYAELKHHQGVVSL